MRYSLIAGQRGQKIVLDKNTGVGLLLSGCADRLNEQEEEIQRLRIELESLKVLKYLVRVKEE